MSFAEYMNMESATNPAMPADAAPVSTGAGMGGGKDSARRGTKDTAMGPGVDPAIDTAMPVVAPGKDTARCGTMGGGMDTGMDAGTGTSAGPATDPATPVAAAPVSTGTGAGAGKDTAGRGTKDAIMGTSAGPAIDPATPVAPGMDTARCGTSERRRSERCCVSARGPLPSSLMSSCGLGSPRELATMKHSRTGPSTETSARGPFWFTGRGVAKFGNSCVRGRERGAALWRRGKRTLPLLLPPEYGSPAANVLTW